MVKGRGGISSSSEGAEFCNLIGACHHTSMNQENASPTTLHEMGSITPQIDSTPSNRASASDSTYDDSVENR